MKFIKKNDTLILCVYLFTKVCLFLFLCLSYTKSLLDRRLKHTKKDLNPFFLRKIQNFINLKSEKKWKMQSHQTGLKANSMYEIAWKKALVAEHPETSQQEGCNDRIPLHQSGSTRCLLAETPD